MPPLDLTIRGQSIGTIKIEDVDEDRVEVEVATGAHYENGVLKLTTEKRIVSRNSDKNERFPA